MSIYAFWLLCVCLIIVALIVFIVKTKAEKKATSMQLVLASITFVLCGYFFSLCLSDFYDIRDNFSLERFVINLFCDAVFLLLVLYALFFNRKKSPVYFKTIVWTAIVFIGIQCFVFPYRVEISLMKILESIEGAAVFALLIDFVLNLKKETLGKRSMFIVVVLEFAVAIANFLFPIAAVTNDFQKSDILLNYQSLFIRPVLFSSIALSYRAWLDRHLDK